MRTPFQSGAEKGHWHDSLGVDQDRTGQQTVRLLGPFHVAFDTADISTTGVALTDLDAGTLIVKAWADIVPVWSGGGISAAKIKVFTAENDSQIAAGNWVQINSQDATYLGAQFDEATGIETVFVVESKPDTSDSPTLGIPRSAHMVVAGKLGVFVSVSGGTPNAGEADIYALIAEPAS